MRWAGWWLGPLLGGMMVTANYTRASAADPADSST